CPVAAICPSARRRQALDEPAAGENCRRARRSGSGTRPRLRVGAHHRRALPGITDAHRHRCRRPAPDGARAIDAWCFQGRRNRYLPLVACGASRNGSRSMTVAALPERAMSTRVSTRTSDLLYRNRWLLAILLLGPPLLWIGVVYVGSLLAFLLNSFYGLDEFSGLIDYRFTLSTFAQLFQRANFDIIARSVLMATAVTLASAVIAFPVAYYAARYARGKLKAFFYLAVMMPLWSSYLVKIYAWKLILAKEGIITWLAQTTGLAWFLNALLALPVIGGPSLSISYIGMFLVFVYVWLPYMILPTQAALERVPASLVEASADLGANPWLTLRTV